jgi:hypothetical protein
MEPATQAGPVETAWVVVVIRLLRHEGLEDRQT